MLIFVEGGNRRTPEKNPRSRDENQQQTQPTGDAGSGFGVCYRGFPAFLARSTCLKTAKLRRLRFTRIVEQRNNSEVEIEVLLRGCLHDIGATFIPARVHSGSLLWLCIRLHDTNTKFHAGASHTGPSSPRFLCRSEIFIPARKFIPVLCKRGMTVRFISIKVSSILRHYKTRTPTNTALCKRFSSHPVMKVAPLSCKHPLKPVNNPLGVSPSKGKQGTTRGKEKIF